MRRRSLAVLLPWFLWRATSAADSAPRLRLRKDASSEDDGSRLTSRSVFNSTLAASVKVEQQEEEDPWWQAFNKDGSGRRPGAGKRRRKWTERQRRRLESKVKDRVHTKEDGEADASAKSRKERDPIKEKIRRSKTFREKWGGSADGSADHFKDLREARGKPQHGQPLTSGLANGGKLDPAGTGRNIPARAAGAAVPGVVVPVGDVHPGGTGRGPQQHGMVDPVGDGSLDSAGKHSGGSPAPLHVVEPTLGEPRVFLLFLVDKKIDHAEHWHNFLTVDGSGSFRTFVHCKDPENEWCKSSGGLGLLPGAVMVETVDSWYCHDLVTSMVQLLNYATKAEGASQLDKFVFLSDSTLPVKPPSEIYGALTAEPGSDVCFFPKAHWAHSTVEGHRTALLLKHHQWVVLNRQHAQRMVTEWKAVDAQGHWDVPLQRGSGSDSVYTATDFKRSPNANWCTDEWGFFATLFGAVIETTRSGDIKASGFNGPPVALIGSRAEQSQGVCRTFAFFSEDDPALAALARAVASDHTSKVSCWPVCTPRPMAFAELGDVAVTAMRQSEYLFARKFRHGAMSSERFQRIILAQDPPSNTSSTDQGASKGIKWW